MPRTAALFDFGGVITTSPFEAFAAYEREVGLPPDTIRRINSTNPDTNAWAQFERSEVDVDTFADLFAAEGAALGLTVDGHRVLACLSGSVRPEMVVALDRINAAGIPLGCITNNVNSGEGPSMSRDPKSAADAADAMSRFSVVIESSKVGVRKPSPEIYLIACRELGVEPTEAVYLDDLGINCKAAHQLGMAAIKVTDAASALNSLESELAITLR